MSNDRRLDELMERDIAPEGPIAWSLPLALFEKTFSGYLRKELNEDEYTKKKAQELQEWLLGQLRKLGFTERPHMEPPFVWKGPKGMEISVSSVKYPDLSATSNRKRYEVNAYFTDNGVAMEKSKAASSYPERMTGRIMADILKKTRQWQEDAKRYAARGVSR